MPKRLIITIVCFHITAALSVLAAIGILAASLVMRNFASLIAGASHSADPMAGQMFGAMGATVIIFVIAGVLLSIASAVGIELVIRGLYQLKYWAWIVGIVICGLMIISGFHNIIGLVLGGLALWGLVDPESVAAFKPTANVPAGPNDDY
jgi:hypothetical protein